MWDVECGVWGVECGCGLWSVECRVWGCGVWGFLNHHPKIFDFLVMNKILPARKAPERVPHKAKTTC